MKSTPRTLLIVLAVVAAAAFLGLARCSTPGPSTGLTAPRPAATSAVEPVTPTDGDSPAGPAPTDGDRHGDGDDGVAEDPPSIIKPTEKPDVREAATAFAASWLNTYPRVSPAAWRARLLDQMTSELAADMADADPASVPAGGKVGSPVQVKVDGSLHTAEVPVVTAGTAKPQPIGTLRLTLVNNTGTWLISEIDWEGRP